MKKREAFILIELLDLEPYASLLYSSSTPMNRFPLFADDFLTSP